MEQESRGNGLLWALVGCGALLFVGLCTAMGAGAYLYLSNRPAAPPPGAPIAPQYPPQTPPNVPPNLPPAGASFTLQADVTQVTGSLSGRVSGQCQFAIETVQSNAGLRCRTQILCDGTLVYGGPQSGFFDCRVDVSRRSVSGVDANTTSEDSDAAMTIDTDSHVLIVRDDASGPVGAFTLAATIR